MENVGNRDEMLTVTGLAEYTGLGVGTVYNMRSRGEGPPSFRIGRGSIRYKRSEVDAWLEQQREQPQRESSVA